MVSIVSGARYAGYARSYHRGSRSSRTPIHGFHFPSGQTSSGPDAVENRSKYSATMNCMVIAPGSPSHARSPYERPRSKPRVTSIDIKNPGSFRAKLPILFSGMRRGGIWPPAWVFPSGVSSWRVGLDRHHGRRQRTFRRLFTR